MERVVSYAKQQFKMFTQDAKGITLYESLKTAEKAGFKPPELIEFENTLLPSDCAEVWQDFMELSNSRSQSENGPNGLTYQDIVAWNSIVGKQPSSFRSEVLFAIDREWTSNFYKNQEKIRKQMSKQKRK